MSLADRLGRVAMLVLSGLSTLALIGALATLSHGPVTPPGSIASRAVPPDGIPPVDPRQESFAGVEPTPMGKVTPDVAQAIAQRETAVADNRIAESLETLAYAVLALAGFAAAGLLVLLRITTLLARIADRDD
ncbi:hypothetical protein [Sphingomonas sp. 3-13AW]|jgi:hypothetical protein|uniref:hypothetical protein n=1 Tax=Sphingomonas sp. 3-13AW TaxID=3050450 RepID=UPI003BB4F84C